MGKHVGIKKGFNVFEFRYYQRRVIDAWVKLRRRIKARLNHG